MITKKRNPKWWQVYLALPVLMGLFWLEMQIPLTYTENVLAQLGLLFLFFGYVQRWLRENRSALMHLDQAEGEWHLRVYEIPPSAFRGTDRLDGRLSRRPMLQIPAAGVKGVLSDTFEWETPEEESTVFADQDAASRKE
jgi:hypothetical protein